MKIAAISDLHGKIPEGNYPEIELLIIAGDLAETDVIKEQEDWFLNVFKDSMPKVFPDLQEIYIIPGNHDYWIERNYKINSKIRNILGKNVTILVDELKCFTSFSTGEKVIIYGNPRTSCGFFAFPHLYENEDIVNIPDNIDILVTHEAPRINKLDCINKISYNNEYPGSISLALKVKDIKPKYHIFGHIHYPCKLETEETTFINVSQFKRKIYNPEIYIIEFTN